MNTNITHVPHDDPIFARYFNPDVVVHISERDYAEGTIEPIERTLVLQSSPRHSDGMGDREFLEGKINEVEEAEGRLSKRLYAQVARAIVKGVIKIVKLIMKKIAADKQKRAQWTSDMIKDFRSKYPSFNFVICHVKHRTDFKGTQGTDWGHQHQELKVSFGKTVGYEIYWFREGTFERLGDGGWLNWSYSGAVKSATKKNSYIVFGRP